jgi:hypothetical protein
MGCASSKPVATAVVSASTTNADAVHAASVKPNVDGNNVNVKKVESTAERRGSAGKFLGVCGHFAFGYMKLELNNATFLLQNPTLTRKNPKSQSASVNAALLPPTLIL